MGGNGGRVQGSDVWRAMWLWWRRDGGGGIFPYFLIRGKGATCVMERKKDLQGREEELSNKGSASFDRVLPAQEV